MLYHNEMDKQLTALYESNGLFAKIIDSPADEALRRGFSLNDKISAGGEDYALALLEEVAWEEVTVTAIKWARLYGGSLVVMLVNDGGGLEDPLNLNSIRSVDGLHVYDRSVIRPAQHEIMTEIYTTKAECSPMPKYYHICSRFGTFTVHESRCLLFRNGSQLHEKTAAQHLWPWGIPEGFRIWSALQDAEISHNGAVRMLEKSVQPVYKIRGLSQMLATEEGEMNVCRRLEALDLARGLLNTIAIDAGDDYRVFGELPQGIRKIVDVSDRMLSAVTGIPEIILWGKPVDYERPGQMWRNHDDASMASWYDLIERIQAGMIKSNLRRLLSVIFRGLVNNGKLSTIPPLNIRFSPLWSMGALDVANAELSRAKEQLTRAEEAAAYWSIGSLRPDEIRRKLQKKNGET